MRRSVDARHKSDVHFVATALVCEGDDAPQAVVPLATRQLPECAADGPRPVVVGMGPAGLFAALELAQAGLRPLVVERGACVEQRQVDVERFCKTRVLDTASNVQFGEGGAGTFSDGKLATGKSSPLIKQILRTFVAAGAPQEILWQAKPHIGTDVLGGMVAELRKRIIACGGEVRFETQLVDLRMKSDGSLRGIVLQHKDGSCEEIEAGSLVLACGHSARDTFELLKARGFKLEQKPFSIGARIEHLQRDIDRAQYGTAAGHPALDAASYKLSCHLQNGRCVYSFCMCPGGEIVAAASEQGALTVNGMSRQARDGINANAALLCNVDPRDYGDASDPLAGITFQRTWEQAAYQAGGADWHAPAQTVGDFCGSSSQPRALVAPSYPLGVAEAPLDSCLPAFAVSALQEALPLLDKRLHGFANPQALLTGIEARSSSPVRIVRDPATLMATRVFGVYPCGEGAGYAGGIMSAALDGLRVAQAIVGATCGAGNHTAN